MTALDWYFLAANFLWVIGLSIILATFSYQNWRRLEQQRPLADLLRHPEWGLALHSGLSLAAVSIVIMPRSERWFIRAIALGFALLFATFAIRARRPHQS